MLRGSVAEEVFHFFSLADKCLCVSMLRHIVGRQLAKRKTLLFRGKLWRITVYIIFTYPHLHLCIEILSCWAAEKAPRLCFEPLPQCSTEMEL